MAQRIQPGGSSESDWSAAGDEHKEYLLSGRHLAAYNPVSFGSVGPSVLYLRTRVRAYKFVEEAIEINSHEPNLNTKAS